MTSCFWPILLIGTRATLKLSRLQKDCTPELWEGNRSITSYWSEQILDCLETPCINIMRQEYQVSPVFLPHSTFMRVVFPAPELPTRAVRTPGWNAPLQLHRRRNIVVPFTSAACGPAFSGSVLLSACSQLSGLLPMLLCSRSCSQTSVKTMCSKKTCPLRDGWALRQDLGTCHNRCSS